MHKALKNILPELVCFMEKKGYKMKPYPKVTLIRDELNSKNILGKTAHYDSNVNKVILYITGRHIKDILRSFTHELIHRHQFNVGIPGYERVTYTEDSKIKDHPIVLKMEKEAYLRGNMVFREWEEEIKMNPANGDLTEWHKAKYQ